MNKFHFHIYAYHMEITVSWLNKWSLYYQMVNEEDIMALCKEHLGSTKTPKSVEFWTELPRSAVGKLLKKDVRAKYWGDQWRSV